MIVRIPFVPFPLQLAKKVIKPFYGIGEKLTNFFPSLSVVLQQAEIDVNAREYLSIAFFALWFWATLVFTVIISIGFIVPTLPANFSYILTFVPIVIGGLSSAYVILYPQLLINKKTRNLEKNLAFALRHLLIQVRSGVPLFDGLVSVSNGDYGLIAEEFKNCVKKISTGMSDTMALEESIFKNPSLQFRRIIWQITNSLRTGADLGDTLDSIVENLSSEQKVAIRKYGSQLNPLSMMYMMTAVIIPSLGITFLILLSSFSGTAVSEILFWMILVALATFQFMFIGIVKNRRPPIEL
jgi:flagellar protein FlaJ